MADSLSLDPNLLDQIDKAALPVADNPAASDPLKEEESEYFKRKADKEQDAQLDDSLNSLLDKVTPIEEAQGASATDDIQELIEKHSGGNSSTEVMSDVAKGFGEGIILSVEQTANFAVDVADSVENMLAESGIGSGDLINEGSRLDTFQKMFANPTSNAEHVGKILGQYLAPYGAVSKLSKATGAMGSLKNIGLASGVSSLIMDPEEKRLADLIQASPSLANPIADLLASEEDDSRLLSRTKNGIESALVDTATLGLFKVGEVVFKSVRAAKAARKIRKMQKISSGDSVPMNGEMIDEAALQAGESQISKAVDEQAAKAKPSTSEGANTGLTKAQAKASVAPKVPKRPKLSPQEEAVLADADKYNKSHGDGSVDFPDNMPDLLKYMKEKDIKPSPDFLHRVSKRGTVSDKENLKMAEKIFAEEGKVEEFFSRKFGDTLSQEERTAMKLQYMSMQLEVENFVKGVKNVDELTEAELSVFRERLTNLDALDASIDAASSEAGRALRTSKRMPGINEGTEQGLKQAKIKEHIKLHGGIQDIKETIKQIQQIQNSNLSLFDAIRYKNSKSIGDRAGDALFEYWVNNVLSGPSTWLVTNPLSNIVQTFSSIAETGTAEIYSKFLRRGLVEGETLAHIGGLVDGFWEGLTAAGKFWKGVQPGTRSKFMLANKRSISAKNFGLDPASTIATVTDTIGGAINLPTKMLSTQDVFFNVMHQRARINQLAHRRVIQSGLTPGDKYYVTKVADLVKNPTRGMHLEAERFGQEHTLTTPLGRDGGAMGKSLQALQQALKKVPFGVGSFAGAFMRVGTNIADRAIQRTPISFLRAETRRNLMSGVSTSAHEEMGKMIFGTGVLFGGGLLAHGGYVTGNGPDDPKTKKALKSSGWQERSIRLPGGGWMKLDTLGPIGVVLGMGADVTELIGRIDATDTERAHLTDELFIAGSTILLSAMTPEYLQQGVPDLFSLVKDVAEGRAQPDQLAASAARFSTGFIPFSGFVKAWGDTVSPQRGDTRPQPHSSVLSGAWQRVKGEWLNAAGLDGYAGLPPELNIFGEEVFSPLGVGTSAKSAIFSNNRDPNDIVVKELIRLDSTGAIVHIESPNEESLAIRMPERVKRKGIGQGVTVPVSLTPQQYHDYVKLAAGLKVGKLSIGAPPLKEAWAKLISSSEYKKQTDDMKKKLIKDVSSKYKTVAWQIMMARPDIIDEMSAQGKIRANRLFKRGN